MPAAGQFKYDQIDVDGGSDKRYREDEDRKQKFKFIARYGDDSKLTGRGTVPRALGGFLNKKRDSFESRWGDVE